MAWHRCSAIVAALLLLGVLSDLDLFGEVWRDLKYLRPSLAEPEDLQERLRLAMPPRQISEAEHQVLERDGVLLLRGLVKDTELLRELAQGLAPHQQIHGAVYRQPWRYNGMARALLRQVTLADLGADLLRATGPIKMREAPIWGVKPLGFHLQGSWHQDQVATISEQPMVSIWIALTEAPHSVEFLLGSHSTRAELLRRCNRSNEGAFGVRLLNHRCALEFVGEDALFAPDLRPGDAIAFDGNVTHRSVTWPRHRTAIAPRFEHHGRVSTPCTNDEGGIIFRHDGEVVRPAGLDPLACARELALPRPEELWPGLKDWLPREKPLLRSFMRAATHAWCALLSSPDV